MFCRCCLKADLWSSFQTRLCTRLLVVAVQRPLEGIFHFVAYLYLIAGYCLVPWNMVHHYMSFFVFLFVCFLYLEVVGDVVLYVQIYMPICAHQWLLWF